MLLKDFYKTVTSYVDEIGCLNSPQSYASSHKIVSTVSVYVDHPNWRESTGGDIIGWYEKNVVGEANMFVFRVIIDDVDPTICTIDCTPFNNLNDFYISFKNYIELNKHLLDNDYVVAFESVNDSYDYEFQEIEIDQLGGCGCWVGIVFNLIRTAI